MPKIIKRERTRYKNTLGKYIKRLRKEKKLSQKRVAKQCKELEETHYKDIEKGEANPSDHILVGLAKFFNVNKFELLKRNMEDYHPGFCRYTITKRKALYPEIRNFLINSLDDSIFEEFVSVMQIHKCGIIEKYLSFCIFLHFIRALEFYYDNKHEIEKVLPHIFNIEYTDEDNYTLEVLATAVKYAPKFKSLEGKEESKIDILVYLLRGGWHNMDLFGKAISETLLSNEKEGKSNRSPQFFIFYMNVLENYLNNYNQYNKQHKREEKYLLSISMGRKQKLRYKKEISIIDSTYSEFNYTSKFPITFNYLDIIKNVFSSKFDSKLQINKYKIKKLSAEINWAIEDLVIEKFYFDFGKNLEEKMLDKLYKAIKKYKNDKNMLNQLKFLLSLTNKEIKEFIPLVDKLRKCIP